MEYLKNPRLEFISPEFKGNIWKDKRFHDPAHDFEPKFSDLFRFMLSSNPQKEEKKADNWRPEVIKQPEILRRSAEDNYWVWLGHASFLFQFNGIRLLTDPMLTDLPVMKRLVNIPFGINELQDLDYVLVSHDHRDHCDESSLKSLAQNNDFQVLTSLKLSNVMGSWLGKERIMEAAWFQRFALPEKQLEIIFLPSRHWCRRGLFDFNHTLWGSCLIRTPDVTIYFGGDSSYGPHFKQIGELFPDIDLAFLGVGAYKPEFMMKEVHTSPDEAVQAFHDLGAKHFVPMHFGTYDLSNEPISEPPVRVRELFGERPEAFTIPKVGARVAL